MENKRSHGGSQNTFIFGVLVGVLITLLFTTKKGRKLLKTLTEEGIDRLSHWEEVVERLEKNVSKVKDSVKEELYKDQVEEDTSLLGEEVSQDIQEEIAEEVDEVVEEKDEVEQEIEDVEGELEEPVVEEPKSTHKLERIQLHRPSLKKAVKKAPVKKVEPPVIEEEEKPKRRLFKGIKKKA